MSLLRKQKPEFYDPADQYAQATGVPGLCTKPVFFSADKVETDFAQYQPGELACAFLNYDPAPFFALKQKLDASQHFSEKELTDVFCAMPYYRDMVAGLPAKQRAERAMLFARYPNGVLWEDAAITFQIVQDRYRVLVDHVAGLTRKGYTAAEALKKNVHLPLDCHALGPDPRDALADAPPPRSAFALYCSKADGEVHLAERFVFRSMLDMVYQDLFHAILAQSTPHSCQNCGRYFFSERGYNYAYCNNVAPGEDTRTCRMVGAANTQMRKFREDATTRIFTRAYKRYYARVLKQQWTRTDFDAWRDAATVLRKAAEEQRMSAEEFEARLRGLAGE